MFLVFLVFLFLLSVSKFGEYVNPNGVGKIVLDRGLSEEYLTAFICSGV